MRIVQNGKVLRKVSYPTEREFEQDVVASSKVLFGARTVYVDAKRKIESKTLGGTIPDGFLFDFSDPTDPHFYLVEVEVSQHSFFEHIFPQITKFFAFYKNKSMQKSLVDKLHAIIDSDKSTVAEIKKYIGSGEVYKFLIDIVETSQNILLIVDDAISEMDEISETYTDTWGRLVRYVQVAKYSDGTDSVYCIDPEFEVVQHGEPGKPAKDGKGPKDTAAYDEAFHLENSETIVKDLYQSIKDMAFAVDSSLSFNPQKYYISLRGTKNLAYLEIRKRKIRFIVLLPEKLIREIAKEHNVVSLSDAVQKFYNSECASVDLENLENMEEIKSLISELSKLNRESS